MRRGQVSLSVADDIRAVSRAAHWVDERIANTELSGERRHDLHVCLEEALANLILHAKAASDDKGIRVEVVSEPNLAIVIVRDRCQAFDLTCDVTFNPNEQSHDRTGGHGVRLLRTLSSELRYQAKSDGNELTMLFRETQ